MYEDPTVDNMEQGMEQVDAGLTPMQETEEQHPGLETLLEDAPQEETQQAPTEAEVRLPKREPGWVRQRVDKAVQRAVQETEARMRAEFESQMAPIRESMMDREADQLIAAGEFKSKERALEYVRMKAGLPSSAQQPTRQQAPQQPEATPEVKARANILAKQAEKIKTQHGYDVMGEFNANPEVRKNVLSGDWDFYDVAEYMEESGAKRRQMPRVVRSPGSSGLSGNFSIDSMSDKQFNQLLNNLDHGAVYDAR